MELRVTPLWRAPVEPEGRKVAPERIRSLKVGVLALQGDVDAHMRALEGLGLAPSRVKYPKDLKGLDALILPGGESTTIGRLMERFELLQPLREFGESGKAIMATCAGMVLVAREIIGFPQQPRLSLMDISVERNAFGRQINSFEAELEIKGLSGGPFRAVFIRAPVAKRAGPSVEVLAQLPEGIVAAREGKILALAFHPELTDDPRLHLYFLEIAAGLR